MVHTLPDYTTKYKMSTIFGQIDTGELAARLGSPSARDRRGNVIWYDTFENINNSYHFSKGGADSTYAVSTDYSYMGGHSMRLTAGDTTDDYFYLWKLLPQTIDTRIGVEAHLFIDMDDAEIEFGFGGWSGTNSYDARVKYRTSTNAISYYNSAGGYTALDTREIDVDIYRLWSHFKLVYDWSTKKYIRFILSGEEYDLSGISAYSSASVADPMFGAVIGIMVKGDTTTNLYVDDLIITQNEN